MARPNVFQTDTTLYHAVEGARVFPRGETDPGAAWSDRIGGEIVGKETVAQALKDLITAHDQIANLETRLTANASDLAESAKTREEALAKVHGLEQRAVAAEKFLEAAEAQAKTYMAERDQARAEVSHVRAKAAPKAAEPEAEPEAGAEPEDAPKNKGGRPRKTHVPEA
jgi:hypothetical protein